MSAWETVEFAELKDLSLPGRHTLVIGQPRSGKTSCLLTYTVAFFSGGETVIVRDIGEFFEWFSVLDYDYPIRGLVPEGCRILYEHPNFEQVEFDVTDLYSLFDALDPKKINLVFFESFCLEVKNYVQFWSNFFKQLLPWKQQPGNGGKRFCLIMDEFGDIAPGKGRTYIRGQNRLSQLIAMNHRKFRRHRIRLLAAVHYFRDITPPIRERFDCYIINTNYPPNPKEVPYTLRKYAEQFPELPVDEVVFVDSTHHHNKIPQREEIPPRRYYDISVRGNADKLMKKATPKSRLEKRAEKWEGRSLDLATELMDRGLMTGPEIAEIWEVKPSTIYSIKHQHEKGFINT